MQYRSYRYAFFLVNSSDPPGSVRISAFGPETNPWCVGDGVILTCEVVDAGILDLQADFRWTKLENASFSRNGPTLDLQDLQLRDSGTYDCHDISGKGAPDSYALTIEPAPELVFLESSGMSDNILTVEETDPRILNCSARGWPGFELTWCQYGSGAKHNCQRALRRAFSAETQYGFSHPPDRGRQTDRPAEFGNKNQTQTERTDRKACRQYM